MRQVPQAIYTVDYYVHNCDGYTEDGSLCPRLKMLLSNVDGWDRGHRVLDIGSGRGEVSKYFSSLGHEVLAVDYSFASMMLFHDVNGDRVPFIRHDVSRGFPWLASYHFDTIVLADVFEHLYEEQQRVLGCEVMRLCSEGGRVLIDTPVMTGDASSEYHVGIRPTVADVVSFFPGARLLKSEWYYEPAHCNIILTKE
jgi:2-polyprenyl-3-methyl-5-hydroxy-6-metoxy-1,4-benzoquinol methylase